jgi:hypothetical protein
MDFEKPETKHLVLKPRVIVPTDKPTVPGEESAISVQAIHAQNVQADKLRKKKAKGGKAAPLALPLTAEPALSPVFKPKEITALNSPVRPGDEEAIDVADILLENRVAEEKSGWGRLKKWRRRKSKRGRDFLIIVGGIDLSIAFLMKVMPNGVALVYGLSAITLATTTLGWIMFVVMDDY